MTLEKDEKTVEEKTSNPLEKRLVSSAVTRLFGIKEKRKNGVVGARLAIAFLGSLGLYIAIPTVAGAFIGKWLEGKYPEAGVNWSLNLILCGLLLGVFTASRWLKREAIDSVSKYQKSQEKQRDALKKEIEEKNEKKEVEADDI